ncbi:8462_t:CDS:1, partial [Cetraspora pellucida]
MESTLTYYCGGCKTFKPISEFESNRDNISQFQTCSNCRQKRAGKRKKCAEINKSHKDQPEIIDIDYLDHILTELLEDAQENGLEFCFCYEIIIDNHSSTKEIANDVVELIEDIDKYNW